MLADLMRFEIHGGIEDHKFLLLALCIHARIVIAVEVPLQVVIVEEVPRFARVVSITQMATLVSVTKVYEQLVVTVESLFAKFAIRMSLEPSLLRSAIRVCPLVLAQLLWGEELMLVREDFLVPSTQVTHDLLMLCPNVTVEVWPAQASFVTVRIRAVVAQEYNSVLKYLLLLVADAHVPIIAEEPIRVVVLESLFSVVREDDCGCLCTAMGASFRLVERPHAQSADVTCPVVARRYTVVVDVRSTDEAQIRVVDFFSFGSLSIFDQATADHASSNGLLGRLRLRRALALRLCSVSIPAPSSAATSSAPASTSTSSAVSAVSCIGCIFARSLRYASATTCRATSSTATTSSSACVRRVLRSLSGRHV
jgi:hypothetical protein